MLTFVSFGNCERVLMLSTIRREYFAKTFRGRGLVDADRIDLTTGCFGCNESYSSQTMAKDFWCEDRINYNRTAIWPETQVPESVRFLDFLPKNARIADEDPWEVVCRPIGDESQEWCR